MQNKDIYKILSDIQTSIKMAEADPDFVFSGQEHDIKNDTFSNYSYRAHVYDNKIRICYYETEKVEKYKDSNFNEKMYELKLEQFLKVLKREYTNISSKRLTAKKLGDVKVSVRPLNNKMVDISVECQYEVAQLTNKQLQEQNDLFVKFRNMMND